jgi:LytS/YehU family sensor histidine kinase
MAEDNQKVVEYIQNLSGLLRYMLNSRERELVFLSEELEITKSYTALQITRFGKSLNIKNDIPDYYNNFLIPPLTLQMLVENCIKHNIISIDKPLNIYIAADKEYISVSNNLQTKNDAPSTGQGLKNIAGRYHYFTTKEIEVLKNEMSFVVRVPLLRADT